jgi:hypothetical protein
MQLMIVILVAISAGYYIVRFIRNESKPSPCDDRCSECSLYENRTCEVKKDSCF